MKVKRKMHSRYLSACFGLHRAAHRGEERAAIERIERDRRAAAKTLFAGIHQWLCPSVEDQSPDENRRADPVRRPGRR
jgi:hypothetical protein